MTMSIILLIGLSLYVNRIIQKESREKEMLKHSIHIDLLTQLFTRAKFNEDIQSIYDTQKPSEIAMIDIDFFKRINDTYGHCVGDRVLEILALKIKQHFPEPNFRLYRWGGEEFIILGTDIAAELFDQQLDDFREFIENHIVVNDMNVTVSVGTASVEKTDFKAIFNSMDTALYEAKRTGRNRLIRGGKTLEDYIG